MRQRQHLGTLKHQCRLHQRYFFVSIHKIISDLFSINPYFEETVTRCLILLTLYKNVLLAQSDKSCFLYNFSRVIALFFCSDVNSKVKMCIFQLFEYTPDHDTTHIDIFFSAIHSYSWYYVFFLH